MRDIKYTGLKDKNGWDVYEGDILHIGHARETFIPVARPGMRLEVFFSAAGFNTREGTLQEILDWHECEVIGNIYENPDLLEGVA